MEPIGPIAELASDDVDDVDDAADAGTYVNHEARREDFEQVDQNQTNSQIVDDVDNSAEEWITIHVCLYNFELLNLSWRCVSSYSAL